MADLLQAENDRLRTQLARYRWRIDRAVHHVRNQADHTEPCAVLAAEVVDILDGRRDPQAGR